MAITRDSMHNSLKERVLELTDIVEVIGERIALTRKGREMVGLCPFHDDHSPSLNVSPSKQIFKCWVCGVGGDVIKFVQSYERVDFRAALEQLALRAGLDARLTPEDNVARGARDQLRRAVDWARRVFQRELRETPAGKAALEYAFSRG
ncbi:MAG: DNA primase, partial [Phycisphaerae bacterium]|nr:DNA primase [Phycisphaerae bacterium]